MNKRILHVYNIIYMYVGMRDDRRRRESSLSFFTLSILVRRFAAGAFPFGSSEARLDE